MRPSSHPAHSCSPSGLPGTGLLRASAPSCQPCVSLGDPGVPEAARSGLCFPQSSPVPEALFLPGPCPLGRWDSSSKQIPPFAAQRISFRNIGKAHRPSPQTPGGAAARGTGREVGTPGEGAGGPTPHTLEAVSITLGLPSTVDVGSLLALLSAQCAGHSTANLPGNAQCPWQQLPLQLRSCLGLLMLVL